MTNKIRVTETGIEKVFLHTDKLREIVSDKMVDNTYPVSVELTLTNKCNLNCCYCSDKDLRNREGVKEELSFENIKKLFLDLKRGGTKGVVIEGGGEPTLHKDFNRIIWLAKEIGLSVGLITNGTKEIEKELLDKFQWIRVSLDASNADEFLNIKGLDLFESVIKNIVLYKEKCSTVGVGYIVTKENINNLDALVIRLREIGVDYIQFRPVVDYDELMVTDASFEYLKKYETDTFLVDVSGFENNSFSGNGGVPCYASSLTSVISGDGNVFICGRLNIYSWLKPIGNIKIESFNSIWNGCERERQIKMVNEVEFCKKYCPQCRLSKYNLFFEGIKKIRTVDFI